MRVRVRARISVSVSVSVFVRSRISFSVSVCVAVFARVGSFPACRYVGIRLRGKSSAIIRGGESAEARLRAHRCPRCISQPRGCARVYVCARVSACVHAYLRVHACVHLVLVLFSSVSCLAALFLFACILSTSRIRRNDQRGTAAARQEHRFTNALPFLGAERRQQERRGVDQKICLAVVSSPSFSSTAATTSSSPPPLRGFLLYRVENVYHFDLEQTGWRRICM